MSCVSNYWTFSEGQRLQPVRLDVRFPSELDMNFLLYMPDGSARQNQKWPLLIFLHGIGERGDDLEKVKVHGPPKRIEEGSDFPFIMVAPQCPADAWWSVAQLDRLLDFLLQELPVDDQRIYLTGLSIGGFAAWTWAQDRPERFAALAPICGGGEPFMSRRIKDVPIWVFHGANDPVVSPHRSQAMVDALKKVGADNVRFTLYPDTGHDSWTATYENPEFYEWLLQQNLANRKRP